MVGGQVRKGDMIYREFGRSGELISAIGVGGFHLGPPGEAEAIKIVRTAIDRGITFMDNSWDYNNGASEERMGKALKDGYRDKVFLMTKIDGRTGDAATKQLEESLRRLQTDHLDLLQHHEIIRMEDPDRVFADDGAQAALEQARKDGKIRYIGFTGHKDPAVHLRMLDMAEKHGVKFDAVQMPINVMDAHFRSFTNEVLPRLVRDGIAPLGMKPCGSGEILKAGVVSGPECLRYALSRPTAVVITGMDSMKMLEQALAVARDFTPYSAEEIAALLAKTAPVATEGRFERFKTSSQYDSTAKHPEWLG
jgi:aryl-alcohol dehydrogenase-like predicted oxidoreductase